MIQQRAVLVDNGLGRFIAVVAFDASMHTLYHVLQVAYGTSSVMVREYDAHELNSAVKEGGKSLFTYSHNE